MSVGYLSRLNKEDNTAIPSIEFIASAAEKLGVSVEVLISHDCTQQTATEAYLLKFLDKLIADTDADKLYWTKDLQEDLESSDEYDFGSEPSHPLFYIDWEHGESNPVYCSYYNRERRINGDCFSLHMPSGDDFYLMTTVDPTGHCALELYLVQQRGTNKLCQSDDSSQLFSSLLDTLYYSAADSCKRPKLSPFVKDVIDRFMVDDLNSLNDSDDLPF